MLDMNDNIGGGRFEATANIRPFLFEDEHLVRVVEMGEDPWFVAKDACAILGIKNVSQAVENFDADEKGICSTDTLGGAQEVVIVSEGGLYTLIVRSRLAMTPGTVQHRFRKWVTGEVLPTIRKTGSFVSGVDRKVPVVEEVPDLVMKIRMVNACRPIFGNQAAGQLWFHLGLPDMPAMHPDPRQLTIFEYQEIKVEGDANA